jgi:nitroreductase
MSFRDLVLRTRTIRRFREVEPVPLESLESFVDLARLTASAGNLQPLRYALCCNAEINQTVFECLGWAAYLPAWPGPAEGERPAAYIVMLRDGDVAENCDVDAGIAAQTVMLAASAQGLGGCILASVNREKLAAALDIPDSMHILLVLALGKPAEKSVLEPLGSEGSVKYWRDLAGVHHVPKRELSEVIVARFP